MPISLFTLIKQAIFYPKNFIQGRMQTTDQSTENLQPGQGVIIDLNGKKVAAYKDPDGKVQLHSAVCPHLGCITRWNSNDQTFDCPCHGSRFAADGTLQKGPAQRGLDPIL